MHILTYFSHVRFERRIYVLHVLGELDGLLPGNRLLLLALSNG